MPELGYEPEDYIEPPRAGEAPGIAADMPAAPHLMSSMLDWLIHTGKLVPVEHDPFAPEGPR